VQLDRRRLSKGTIIWVLSNWTGLLHFAQRSLFGPCGPAIVSRCIFSVGDISGPPCVF
jgi:hypothetical protein